MSVILTARPADLAGALRPAVEALQRPSSGEPGPAPHARGGRGAAGRRGHGSAEPEAVNPIVTSILDRAQDGLLELRAKKVCSGRWALDFCIHLPSRAAYIGSLLFLLPFSFSVSLSLSHSLFLSLLRSLLPLLPLRGSWHPPPSLPPQNPPHPRSKVALPECHAQHWLWLFSMCRAVDVKIVEV